MKHHNDPIPVLDKGHVRLVDTMGDDSSIVQAARTSYGKGTKTVNQDRGLIRYLMRNYHTSPFEFCEIKLHLKMPIFVARQFMRHRTASINEYSGRYSEMEDQFYLPEQHRIRRQSTTNKQGSGSINDILDNCDEIQSAMKGEQAGARSCYEGYLESEVAREMARINLPMSQYTEFYWKTDLHNLLHFLRLRLDSHAQYEIRQYAEAIAEIIKAWVPDAWEAFEDYRLNAVSFSAQEMKIISDMVDLAFTSFEPSDYVQKFRGTLSKRELTEFFGKIGIPEVGYTEEK